MNDVWKKRLLSAFSLLGTPLLLALANPGSELPLAWLLGWVAWIPIATRLLSPQPWKTQRKTQLRDGFVLGVVFHLWVTHWLTSLHPLMWMGLSPSVSFIGTHLAWLVISLMGGLYVAPIWLLMNQWKKAPLPFLLQIPFIALTWAVGFYVLHLSPLGLPVGFNVYSQAITPWYASALHTLSFWGYEALILCFSLLVVKALQVQSKFSRVAYGILAILCFFLPIGIGYLTPQKPDPLQGIPVVVMSKQPDIETIRSENYRPDEYVHVFEREFQQKKQGWGLVILPEGALPHQNTPFKGITNEILIAGAFIYEEGKVYNGAVIRYPAHLNHPQVLIRKRILVPFGETTPILSEQFVRDTLKTIGMDYSTGNLNAGSPNGSNAQPIHIQLENPKTHTKHALTLGVLVCFEAFYPSLYWPNKPDAVINISNLSWFHGNQQLSLQVKATLKHPN